MADWMSLVMYAVLGFVVVLAALACRARSMDLELWQQEEEAAYQLRRTRLEERLEASRHSDVRRPAPHAWPGVAFRNARGDGPHRA